MNMATTLPEKCYYEELGIEKSASDADVNAAYKRLAKVKHPDKNPENPKATEQFQLVSSLITPFFP